MSQSINNCTGTPGPLQVDKPCRPESRREPWRLGKSQPPDEFSGLTGQAQEVDSNNHETENIHPNGYDGSRDISFPQQAFSAGGPSITRKQEGFSF